jgi:hypothetical protein
LSQRKKIAANHRIDSTDGMKQSHVTSNPVEPLPQCFVSRLEVFADLFTRPTWSNVLVLLAGAILAPGRRTVTATLRILGLDGDPHFCTFHRILNRARWSSREVAGRLFLLLVSTFAPVGPVVIGFDDTIERRWGPKISARGIYRDPVRSSKGHFVKASGLRWLSAMLLVNAPWAGRILALPFLTILAPSKRFYDNKPRSPKTLVDCARQAVLQICRWLPGRYIVIVADSAFAVLGFLAAVRKRVCVVTRLRLDANLFDVPPQKRKRRGRPPIKGKRLPKLSSVLKNPRVSWQRLRISRWYGQTNRLIEVATGTALWYHPGIAPVPIRWIIVRDPTGQLEPQAFLCTDLSAKPRDIIAWFVSRWNVEVTFQEVRAHLGVETQRQWSDNAILRTTPALLALYSIITLLSNDLYKRRKFKPRTAAWYTKTVLTFSDAIAAVRREIWLHQISFMSRRRRDSIEIPRHIWNRVEDALAYAA